MKYLILENHKSYSIALDEAGRFIKVANMNYEIGDRVQEVFPIVVKDRGSSSKPKIFSIVAAIAACLVLILTTVLNSPPPSYASIYMSINPNVKLDVSVEGTVVGIDALNGDGSTLIEGYSWKKKSMDTVSKELIDRAIDLGFLSSGGMVKIDINSPDEIWYQDTGIMFRENLDNYVDERLSITIEINKYGEEKPEDDFVAPETKTDVKTPVVKPKVDANSKPTEDSDYGDSDYDQRDDGDSPYGDSDYDDRVKEKPVAPKVQAPKEDDDGDSNYGNSDYDSDDDKDSDSDYEKDSDYDN